MAKDLTPTYVISQEMDCSPAVRSAILKELELCRVMQNTILGEYLKRDKQMKRRKIFKKLIRQYKAVKEKQKSESKNNTLSKDLTSFSRSLPLL
ncbi:hypothetical protein [Siminovitchia terrae]|uniref:hypothetical protein n=1 Tax=Siminovitchia terrae TaxID=1914933 RepID=UPI0028ABCF80|nr:hypothetical protein [Siminovitchia terrae]